MCGGPAESFMQIPLTCSKACLNRRHSLTMASTNRRHCSKRMKANNPMRSEASREKMSQTLKRMHHGPAIRGGNGHGLTACESSLLSHLTHFGFVGHHVVKTGEGRGSGYPTNYKLDLAHRELMVAIEIDGGSHCSLKRRALDEKKTEFLQSIGWKVLRFSNLAVTERLEEVVRTVLSTISK